MKAIVYRRYGSPDVLRLEEVEKPVPGADQVLIRIRAASVNPLDWHFLRGTPYLARLAVGLRAPRTPRLGVDLSGVVEAVGRDVTRFEAGEEVFGNRLGAFGEYVCAGERNLAPKPARLTFEEAAALPVAAVTALQGLRDKGRLQPGQEVLVNGASGGVGTFAVQIGKALGARVTGVCSGRNAALIRSLGADRIVDYTKEDFTKSGARYDLVLDLVGTHALSDYRRALTPSGRLVLAGSLDRGRWVGPFAGMVKAALLSRFVSQELSPFVANVTPEELANVRALVDAGKVRPVIDRRYPLSEVPEAIRYVEAGHARGKVVVAIGDEAGAATAPPTP